MVGMVDNHLDSHTTISKLMMQQSLVRKSPVIATSHESFSGELRLAGDLWTLPTQEWG
jgi:hypothetical protein